LNLADVQADYFLSHWNLRSQAEAADFRRMLVAWGNRLNALTREADFQGFLAEEAQTKSFAPIDTVARKDDHFSQSQDKEVLPCSR